MSETWSHFILNLPLSEIPDYVRRCIERSGGTDFYFVQGKDERGFVDICHVGNGPKGARNACLISAVHELLAALELYRKAGIGNSTCFETQAEAANAARAAIAKAKGES